jgi:threonine dehydratase
MITKQEIEEAHKRIESYIHRTPIMSSEQINKTLGCEIVFKCENFQKVGAFKTRGAMNAVLSLTDDKRKNGVCTHSSGNHAQALARAASISNIPAYIVMPNNAPQVKIDAVKGYGAEIIFCEPNQKSRENTLLNVMERTNAYFIHPYDNLQIITGQATAAKELIEENTDLDVIIAPVGGGGLLSGTALSTFYFSPKTKVIAAEPKNADDAYRSMIENKIMPANDPITLADGLLTSLGEYTFPIIKEYVSQIITCSESAIVKAMKLVFERMKIIIEPSSATALAIIMENPEIFKDHKIGIIVSGGNIDMNVYFDSLKKN